MNSVPSTSICAPPSPTTKGRAGLWLTLIQHGLSQNVPHTLAGIQARAAVLKDHLHPLALRNVDFGILRRRKNAADLPVETDADAEHQQAGNQHRSDTQRNAPAAAPDQRRTDAAVNRFGGNPRSRHPLSGFEHAGLLVDKPRQFGGAFGRSYLCQVVS